MIPEDQKNINAIRYILQWTRQFRVNKEIKEACLFETKVLRNKTVYMYFV